MFNPNPQSRTPKVRATLYLSQEILDQARNATVHLAGYPARLTLTKLAENALRAELERLKHLYNDGQEFPSATPTCEEAGRSPHNSPNPPCRCDAWQPAGNVTHEDNRPVGSERMFTQEKSKLTSQAAERERLRRELLRLILKNEARRKADMPRRHSSG